MGKSVEEKRALRDAVKVILDDPKLLKQYQRKVKGITRASDPGNPYSLRNQIMIYMQVPDATICAGFHEWRRLGRQVKKGETGIVIIGGGTHKDAETGESKLHFSTVVVFDESQTEPLPADAAARATAEKGEPVAV